MTAKGEGEGRRRRTTQEAAAAGKIYLQWAKNKGAVRQSCDFDLRRSASFFHSNCEITRGKRTGEAG